MNILNKAECIINILAKIYTIKGFYRYKIMYLYVFTTVLHVHIHLICKYKSLACDKVIFCINKYIFNHIGLNYIMVYN